MNTSNSSKDQERRVVCCQQDALDLKIDACVSETRMYNKSILVFSKRISGLEVSENFQQSDSRSVTFCKLLRD